MSFDREIRLAAGAVAEDLPNDAVPKLEALDDLLERWMFRLDLVGFKTGRERVRRYFAEPLLAASSLPPAGEALDIGSGGGSPALPFAIARPSLRWTLLEPRRKRRVFLEEAIRELELPNATVIAQRFEETGAKWEGLAAVSTRGVRLEPAHLHEIVRSLRPGGRFLWFSSESVLRGAAPRLESEGLRVETPRRLLPESSFLLVAEKPPGERFT